MGHVKCDLLTSHAGIDLAGFLAYQRIAQNDGVFAGFRGVEQPRRGHSEDWDDCGSTSKPSRGLVGSYNPTSERRFNRGWWSTSYGLPNSEGGSWDQRRSTGAGEFEMYNRVSCDRRVVG